MKAAALFSGGKDSLYAVYLAEKKGISVDHLITLLTTLPWPSPHAENIESLKILAKSMDKNHIIIDFKEENRFIDSLKNLEIDALVAGDVNVEAHLTGLKDVCNKTDLELIEPIYGKNTTDLFNDIFSLEFKALITGVNLKYLKEEWLGFVISKENCLSFLSKIGNVDPLGENGEFHTLVLDCPLYNRQFKVKATKKKITKEIAYINVQID
ncbi:MAG: diphthine--ammonia ligase [Candidatus Bathyarchaeota archaeon]